MKLNYFFTALCACLLLAAPLPAQEALTPSQASGYVIGPGDVLEISVWQNPDLTKMVTVLPDGKIAFPLIGEIAAAGQTLEAVTQTLKSKLLRFVPDLDLSVMITQVNSMIIYVIGRVRGPGRFVINTNVNVLQALSMAGGLNEFAKKSKIIIFREVEGGNMIFPFDYDEVAKGENLSQNITLLRGDVVIVP